MSEQPLQQEFVNDLINFIKGHPYYPAHIAREFTLPSGDRTEFHLSDPDGDYEEVRIIIQNNP